VLGGSALADTGPLADLIALHINHQFLDAIAAEYRRGRLPKGPPSSLAQLGVAGRRQRFRVTRPRADIKPILCIKRHSVFWMATQPTRLSSTLTDNHEGRPIARMGVFSVVAVDHGQHGATQGLGTAEARIARKRLGR
jgi:hypothetical protein